MIVVNLTGHADGLLAPENLPTNDLQSGEVFDDRFTAKLRTTRLTISWLQGEIVLYLMLEAFHKCTTPAFLVSE